jgi:hypothetical protein
MNERIEIPDYGTLGGKVLSDRIAVLEKRAEGRMMTHAEIAEKRASEKALAEVDAVLRARARIPDDATALDVVWLQMDELAKAGLTYDCLNTDDILASRAQGRV